MAAGDLITSDHQAELRGVLMGADTAYRWHKQLPEWWGFGGMRTNDSPNPQRHGVIAGRDLLGGYALSGQIAVMGDSGSDLLSKLDVLAAAWTASDTDLELVGQWFGSKRTRIGRPRNYSVDPGFAVFGSVAIATVQFLCTDPLIYDTTENSGSTGLPAASGGRTYNLTYNRTYGTVGSGGQINAVNAGTAPVDWIAEIAGPVVDPRIESVTTGQTVRMIGSLASGETLILDSKNRTILLGGTASRYTWLQPASQWFELQPGLNEIRFGGTSGSGTLTLRFKSGRY